MLPMMISFPAMILDNNKEVTKRQAMMTNKCDSLLCSLSNYNLPSTPILFDLLLLSISINKNYAVSKILLLAVS